MLTPLQSATLDQLRPPREERTATDPDLVATLKRRLDDGLAEAADTLDEDLVVNKRKLALVHGCERHLVETENDFSWSVPTARGTVTHKAIELLVYRRGDPTPIDLTEEAVAALEEERKPVSEFLAGLGEPHRTTLVAEVARLVDAFMTMFPPLKRAWRPVSEGSVRVLAADERIHLVGKPDLTLGGPDGDVPGRVIIDLKTGSPARTHRDDLRFYALLDTLKNGVPPLRVASAFLDSGHVEAEEINAGTLEAALRRTVDGAVRLIALHSGERTPQERPGPSCRWCPALPRCESGQIHTDPDLSDDGHDVAPAWPG